MTETTAQITATKRCTKCGKEQSITKFFRDKKAPDGHRTICATCMGIYYKMSRNLKQDTGDTSATPGDSWFAIDENDDTDDYSDLLPLTERDVSFRSWAVITSQEYAKELTIWQIADMLDGYDDCAMNDCDINGGKHD